MKYDFTNKIVLVTGGTGALGRAITTAFIASDAIVVSSYVVDSEIEPTEKREQICSRINQGRCHKGSGSREISFKHH